MSPAPIRFKPTTPLIFVAEDDQSILELVTAQLQAAGFRTAFAPNGWLAWEGIRRTAPDAVVLDINMGGMDGFAVLSAMRAHYETKRTPVLMMTARGAPEDVSRAVDLGAQDYLTKPFAIRQLLQRVGRLVRARSGQGDVPPDQGAHFI